MSEYLSTSLGDDCLRNWQLIAIDVMKHMFLEYLK